MYNVERRKLEDLVNEDVWHLFKQYGVIIAGGAVTSLFTGSEINDLDVYFKSEEQMVRVLAGIFNQEEFSDADLGQFRLVYKGLSQRTIMMVDGTTNQAVQFMTFKYFEDPQEIFDTFDYTVCMGAYDCGSEEWAFHLEFFKHNSQRYLKFNPGTAYPLMSLMRVDKYRQKGYSISKTELLRVVMACMDLPLHSWGDAKEHIGGMYGYDLNDAFYEDREFSLGELSEQLNTLNERDIAQWIPDGQGLDFYSLCHKFCVFPEDLVKEDPGFNDNLYLYKCVDSEWKSPIYSRNPITYIQGDKIDSKEHGKVYFHKSSRQPYHCSNFWVEAKVIEGDIVEQYNQKIAVDGVVEIVRTFLYNPNNDEKTDYLYKMYGLEHETTN